MLTRAKREAAEMEKRPAAGRGTPHSGHRAGHPVYVPKHPQPLSGAASQALPTLSTMGGNQTGIFDELKGAIEEILEEMSDYRVAFAAEDGEDDGEAEKETPV